MQNRLMVSYFEGDLFTAPVDVILHGANCQHTMGSGIARSIREKFPEAYAADCATAKNDPKKMGTYSWARVSNPDHPQIKYVINLYSQFQFGRGPRHTSYDAIATGLESLRDKLVGKTLTLGINYKLGCNLGGGSWPVVESIIYSVFEDFPVKVLICRRPEDRENES